MPRSTGPSAAYVPLASTPGILRDSAWGAAALHNRGMKIAAWVIGLVALATIVTLAQGQQGNDLSSQPRPSRAFCSAAAKYDKVTTTSKPVSIERHITMTHAIATSAPRDTRADARLVWR